MPESLIALRPTKGAFRAMVNAGHFTLPEGTSPDQVWEESMCPGFTYKFFNIQMLQYARSIGTDSQNVPDDVIIRQCAIDKEFLEWADSMGMPYTQEIMHKWSASLSDKEVNRLMKKNGFDKSYHVLALPVDIIVPKDVNSFWWNAPIAVPEYLQVFLYDYLSGCFDPLSIYVCPYFMERNAFFENTEIVRKAGSLKLEADMKVHHPCIKYQTFDVKRGCDIRLCLPIVICKTFQSATVVAKEFKLPNGEDPLLDRQMFPDRFHFTKDASDPTDFYLYDPVRFRRIETKIVKALKEAGVPLEKCVFGNCLQRSEIMQNIDRYESLI